MSKESTSVSEKLKVGFWGSALLLIYNHVIMEEGRQEVMAKFVSGTQVR